MLINKKDKKFKNKKKQKKKKSNKFSKSVMLSTKVKFNDLEPVSG